PPRSPPMTGAGEESGSEFSRSASSKYAIPDSAAPDRSQPRMNTSLKTSAKPYRISALWLGAGFTRWVTAPAILLLIPLGFLVQSVTGTEMLPALDSAGLKQAGHYP